MKALVKLIEATLDADKAVNIVRIDLSGKSSIADYMVIATGGNARQVAAMAEHLAEKLKKKRNSSVPIEGRKHGEWVLVDAGDVIVHIFQPEARTHYALEKMWQAEFSDEPAKIVAGG